MKTPAASLVPQPFLFSTVPRFYFLVSSLSTHQASNLQQSLLPHPSTNPLRAFTSPALLLTRPSSNSAQPRGSLLLHPQTYTYSRNSYSTSLSFQVKTHHKRREPLRYKQRPTQRLKSQISPALYFVPLLIFGTLVLYGIVPSQLEASPISKDIAAGDYSSEPIEEDMELLPGRPGNLTPEEEEKLRKFWEMFLQICGVLGDETSGETDNASEIQGKTGTAGSEKTKKSRMSLFKKRKDKNKDGAATAKVPAMDNIKENDPEDKWGENKAYLDTLATHAPEQIRATIWSMVKHDHPDALFLRFLRARKWDIQKALVMLMSTMNWRCSEAHVDDEVMVNGEEIATVNEKTGDEKTKKVAQDFLAQLRMGKSYCYGTDKMGRPMCIVRARLHKAGEQSEEGLERFTVYLIETTRFMLHPPIDTACVIFDLTGFSLANMDYTPVKFMIKCFEANYPESLGVVLVHKAPWVFQGVWKILRGWLDPVVAGKVHFTNTVKDLEEFVAKERLPDELEGTSGYTYKYVEPVPGENAKMKDLETKEKLLRERETLYEDYESKTIEWINETDATKRAAINSERNSIAKNLRDQYWHLDPYLRSRSFYDRIGVIKPDGSLDYYPSKSINGTMAAVAAGETSADDVD